MEVIFGTAKSRFVNSRIGSFNQGQRFSGPVKIMRELAALGFVTLDEQEPVKKPQSQDDGKEALSSVSPAAPVSPTPTVEPRKKRTYKKKQKSL